MLMPKPNKKLIQENLDEWAKAKAKANRIETARDKQIAPITAAYDKRCASIHESANEQLRPIEEQLKNLEAAIAKEFALGIDIGGRTCALYQASTEKAIAEVQTTEGNREIPPEKFFDQIPEARRDSKFWECVKIQIGKAEKLLGSVVNAIADKPWTAEVVIKLKD